jgi:hypothetical protein
MPEAAKPAKPVNAARSKIEAHQRHAEAPSQEAIAKRAYELYLQRGSLPGYELEDWLSAEAELIAATSDAGK